MSLSVSYGSGHDSLANMRESSTAHQTSSVTFMINMPWMPIPIDTNRDNHATVTTGSPCTKRKFTEDEVDLSQTIVSSVPAVVRFASLPAFKKRKGSIAREGLISPLSLTTTMTTEATTTTKTRSSTTTVEPPSSTESSTASKQTTKLSDAAMPFLAPELRIQIWNNMLDRSGSKRVFPYKIPAQSRKSSYYLAPALSLVSTEAQEMVEARFQHVDAQGNKIYFDMDEDTLFIPNIRALRHMETLISSYPWNHPWSRLKKLAINESVLRIAEINRSQEASGRVGRLANLLLHLELSELSIVVEQWTVEGCENKHVGCMELACKEQSKSELYRGPEEKTADKARAILNQVRFKTEQHSTWRTVPESDATTMDSLRNWRFPRIVRCLGLKMYSAK